MVFTESASGFSTSDLRDVNEQILQVNTLGELIWTADGTHLPGYGVAGHSIDGVTFYWISGTLSPKVVLWKSALGRRMASAEPI